MGVPAEAPQSRARCALRCVDSLEGRHVALPVEVLTERDRPTEGSQEDGMSQAGGCCEVVLARKKSRHSALTIVIKSKCNGLPVVTQKNLEHESETNIRLLQPFGEAMR